MGQPTPFLVTCPLGTPSVWMGFGGGFRGVGGPVGLGKSHALWIQQPMDGIPDWCGTGVESLLLMLRLMCTTFQ